MKDHFCFQFETYYWRTSVSNVLKNKFINSWGETAEAQLYLKHNICHVGTNQFVICGMIPLITYENFQKLLTFSFICTAMSVSVFFRGKNNPLLAYANKSSLNALETEWFPKEDEWQIKLAANESNLSDQSYKCFIQMNKDSLF